MCSAESVSVSYVRCIRFRISYTQGLNVTLSMPTSQIRNIWHWLRVKWATKRLTISHMHTGRDYLFLSYNVRGCILPIGTAFLLITTLTFCIGRKVWRNMWRNLFIFIMTYLKNFPLAQIIWHNDSIIEWNDVDGSVRDFRVTFPVFSWSNWGNLR
jgi:hypothetical protein